jgi:Ca-activated chloride channel homolog
MGLSFNNPEYLWLLLSLPLLVITHFILLKHTKKRAMKFANFEAMSRVAGTTLLTKNMPILILRLCTILLLVFAAAGTTYWYMGQANRNDFILAIDNSASMTAEDFDPNRLEAAKMAASDFLNSLTSKTEISLVTFSGATFVEQMPTSDFDLIRKKIDLIDIAPAGGTDISSAIITGTNVMINSKKQKAIILLTDGSNTAGPFVENIVQRGIDYAKKHHVIIYTVGIGSNQTALGYVPEGMNIIAVYDEETLKQIANQTGGKYYRAYNDEGLKEAFKMIDENSEQGYLSFDLSFICLSVAIMLVFIEWGLINTRFRSIP